MNRVRALWLVTLVVASAAQQAGTQQANAGKQSELATAARRETERRQRVAEGTHSYGNEDLRPASSPGPSPSPTPSASSTAFYVKAPKDDTAAREEQVWREQARQARSSLEAAKGALAAHRQRIEDLRSRLNPMSPSFTNETNEQLQVQAEVSMLQEQEPPVQQAVAEAETALRELQGRARSAGASASWLEPVEGKR